VLQFFELSTLHEIGSKRNHSENDLGSPSDIDDIATIFITAVQASPITTQYDKDVNCHLKSSRTPRSYLGARFMVKEIRGLRSTFLPSREPVSFFGRKLHKTLHKSDVSQETHYFGRSYNLLYSQDLVLFAPEDPETLISVSLPYSTGGLIRGTPQSYFVQDENFNTRQPKPLFIIFLSLGNMICPVFRIYDHQRDVDMRNLFVGGAALMGGYAGIAPQNEISRLVRNDFELYWDDLTRLRWI
jgi:hypothetical protein